MKIGLLTIHDTLNFGSLMQTYALYAAVEELGKDIELIDYKWISRDSRETTYPLSECRTMKDVVKSLMIHRILKKKYDNFWHFIHENMCVSDVYRRDTIKESNQHFDTFLVGSDIVWGLEITGNDTSYFLDFAEDGKKKLAFSSSAGTAWPETEKKHIAELLRRFDAVAVREQMAAEWVKELTGEAPEVSCDPTMLWNVSKWEQLAQKIPPKKEKYVLVYFDALKKQNLYDAVKYAKERGMQVYYVNYGKPVKGVKSVKPVTVEAWLALIRDAETIFSASYHGLLFSLYFHRNVYYYNKTNKSRMSSLSDELGLAEHEGNAENIEKNKPIDYSYVDAVIEQKRNTSRQILERMLTEYGDCDV